MTSPQVESSNRIHIDFANNPDLADIFASKEVGDKCTIKVEVQITKKSSDGVVGAIEKVTSEYEGDGEGEDKEAEPEINKPIAMRILGRKGKSKAGPYNPPPGVMGEMMD